MAVQQAPGLWRTDLQQHDLSVPGHEVVQARVDLGPEAPLVKHTHPGEEIIYVLEGSLEYQVEGQPTRTYNAGEALAVPAGVVHAVRNVGSGNAAELATYVVEMGKPPLPRPPGPAAGTPRPTCCWCTGHGSMGQAGAGSSPSCSGTATTSSPCSCR